MSKIHYFCYAPKYTHNKNYACRKIKTVYNLKWREYNIIRPKFNISRKHMTK